MESILTSIKKLLGIAEDYDAFDMDVIIYINGVISLLRNKGIGPEQGFKIQDKNQTWNDYIPNATKDNLEDVKTYIYMKVRLLFDPPASATAVTSMEKLIAEYEWNITNNADGMLKGGAANGPN